MAGTMAGGKRAATTNKKRHGKEFYAKIGRKGGLKGTTGGFAANVECDCELIDNTHYKRNCAGKKGGRLSTRLGVGNVS